MQTPKYAENPKLYPAPYLRSVLETQDTEKLARALCGMDFPEQVRLSMVREFPSLTWQQRLLLTHPELASAVLTGQDPTPSSAALSGQIPVSEGSKKVPEGNTGGTAGDLFFRLQFRAGSALPELRELLAGMELFSVPGIRSFGTDGLHFYIRALPSGDSLPAGGDPSRSGSSASPDVSFEDYTHMLMHAVFHHMAPPEPVRKRLRGGNPLPLWDLASDMSAEYLRTVFFRDRHGQEVKLAVRASLPQECDPADPLAVYRAISDLFEDELDMLFRRFTRDDHRFWYRAPVSPEALSLTAQRAKDRLLSRKESFTGDGNTSQKTDSPRTAPGSLSGSDLPANAEDPAVYQKWLRKKVLEKWGSCGDEMASGAGFTRSGRYGLAPGSREEKMLLREFGKYDFTRYLQRFSSIREEMALDQASFDYIPYYYGLMRYGNMPLLEPLEYTESRKVEELVIAIDTSGSCSLPIVQRFFAEIERILMNRENFFRKMNIHIIQCDSIIQDHTVIRSQEDWKIYRQMLTIRGRGGTNFEPVFRLVEKLRGAGELKHLKGLLYFTDGDGAYPRKEPDYETAFVFTTRKALQFRIPEWIVPLCLDMTPPEKAPDFRT